MTRRDVVPGPELSELEFSRVVAASIALDHVLTDSDLRISADEALCFATVEDLRAELPAQAIVVPDSGWSGAWFDEHTLRVRLAHLCEWSLPERPGLGQGLIAGIPAKVFLPANSSEALLVVATAMAHEMEERLA
jgi:hypothetical protein